jgi:putative transcriptional regulator
MLSKGRFLVASRGMKDPRFSETVIIVLEYGWHGAVGLIINRPTKAEFSKALPGVKRTEQNTRPVYFGGPVGTDQVRILIRSASQPGDARHVFGDVYVSSSLDLLQNLIDGEIAAEGYRVYAGYAGWAPQQLDKEVLKGGWNILDGDAEAIFNREPSGIWPELSSSP